MSQPTRQHSSQEEFAYQTRMVVYNFLGLVPANSPSDESSYSPQRDPTSDSGRVSAGPASLEHASDSSSAAGEGDTWKMTLRTLPQEHLIDRLNEDSQIASSGSSNGQKSTRESSDASEPSSGRKGSRKSSEKVDLRELHQSVLGEIKVKTALGKAISGREELSAYPVTIIQRTNKAKVMMELRMLSDDRPDTTINLSPQHCLSPQSLQRGSQESDTELVMQLPPPIPMLSAGNLITLSRTNGHASGEQVHHQILCEEEDRVSPMRPFVNQATTSKVERHGSCISDGGSSSHPSSSYVDIQHTNVQQLVYAKAIPPISLSLKMEITKGIEELERSYGGSLSAYHAYNNND